MRMIDADKLHEEIYDLTKFRQDPVTKDWHSPRMVRISEVLRHIDRQPTVDGVEVVRCKNCKFFERTKYGDWRCNNPNGGMGYGNPDDYCSYGEEWWTIRRQDDEKVRD